MILCGHIATGFLAARCVAKKADLRWVVFFSLLADLIDKPVGLVLFRETINNGRVYFHSLLVNLLLTAFLLLAKKPLIYPLALWVHQFFDLMWNRPWVAMWPVTGTFGFRDLSNEQWVWSVLNPYNLWSELAGLTVVVAFVLWFRLYKRPVLVALLSSGRLPVR